MALVPVRNFGLSTGRLFSRPRRSIGCETHTTHTPQRTCLSLQGRFLRAVDTRSHESSRGGWLATSRGAPQSSAIFYFNSAHGIQQLLLLFAHTQQHRCTVAIPLRPSPEDEAAADIANRRASSRLQLQHGPRQRVERGPALPEQRHNDHALKRRDFGLEDGMVNVGCAP